MKTKTTILAAAALSALAMAALPSMAMAFDQPPASGAAGHTFSGTSNNTVTLYGTQHITCKAEGEVPSTTTHGEFTTDDTGWVELTFHGCRENQLNSTCTTAGQPSGTIKTTTLPFHTTYLKPADAEKTHERPGVLITPGAETNEKPHFVTFSCVGGFVNVTIGGNGILGTVTEPGIGETSNSMAIDINATTEGQEHDTTHTEDVTYQLQQSINGGPTSPAYLNAGSNTVSFADGFEASTTTETVEE